MAKSAGRSRRARSASFEVLEFNKPIAAFAPSK
jgi:hypothetical protein